MDGKYFTNERDFFKSSENIYLGKIQRYYTDYVYTTTSEDAESLTLGHAEPREEIRYTYYSSQPKEVKDYEAGRYTYESITTASNVHATEINVGGGGTATDCTCDTMSVYSTTNCSSKSEQDDEGHFKETVYFDYATTYGTATGCTVNSKMEVYNGGTASNCTVNGTLQVQGWDFKGEVSDCVVNGTLKAWLGGEVSNIEVYQGKAVVGDTSSDSDEEFQENLTESGYARAENLVVKEGDVQVVRGGILTGAEIDGCLSAGDGAKLEGDITCSSISLGDLGSSSATITVKVDLNDYAIAVESRDEREDNTRIHTDYYADFHKVVTTYTVVDDSWREVSCISVAFDPEEEGIYDTSEWRHVFEVDLGTIGNYASTGGAPITIDFGDTLSNFDEGTVRLSGTLSGTAAPVVFQSKQDRFGVIVSEYEDNWFDGFSYNSSIYGYGYEVLWTDQGTEGVEYEIDLPEEYLSGATETKSIQARDESGAIIEGNVLPPESLQENKLTVTSIDSNDLVIVSEESDGRQHKCDLELWVVPEVIPGLDKATTGKFAELLKQAQGNLCNISCKWNNIHTNLLGVGFDMTNMGVNFKVSEKREASLTMQGKLEWAISEETPGTGKNTKLVLDLSGDNYISIRFPWKKNAVLDVVGSMTCPDFKVGGFEFSNVSVSLDTTTTSWNVSTYVKLPCFSYAFGGAIGVVDGFWDSMEIGVDGLNVPLGTTGLVLQKVTGSIQDMATSLDMTFGGSLGLTYGPEIDVEFEPWLGIDDGKYSLCAMEVTASISTAGKITGTASVSVLNGLMTGSGSVSAESGCFSLSGEFAMLNGCVSIQGDFNAAGDSVVISGKGTMRTPQEDLFGLLAGIELSVNVEADFGEQYVVAWHESEIFGNKFYVGIRSTFEGDVEILGASALQMYQNLVRSGETRADTPYNVTKQYELSGGGMTLFNCVVESGTTLDATLIDADGTTYTWEDIQAGTYENVRIVQDLSSTTSVVIAVNNPTAGVWTIASTNESAELSADAVLVSALEPVIASVTLDTAGRSATLEYSLGDLTGLEDVKLTIFCDRNGDDARTGICLAQFTPAAATGTYEWQLDEGLDGGDYAFYLQVEADDFTPVQSEKTGWNTFAVLDTEAPDALVESQANFSGTGTVVTWDTPYDNNGIAGYKFRYGTDPENLTEVQISENEFTFTELPNGRYYYQVAAYDEAGNLAQWLPMQECLVNLLSNATVTDCTISTDLTLEDYAGAWKINVAENTVKISVEEDSLIADSTVGALDLGGIGERLDIQGAGTVLDGGQLLGAEVDGILTVADGGTVKDITVKGSMTVEAGASAEEITVADGGILVIEQGAVFSGVSLEYGSVLNIVKGDGYSTSKFQLTGDIYTAGTVNLDRNLYGNGYKIYFEEYKQTAEQYLDEETGFVWDYTGFVNDMSRVVGDAIAVVIDSAVLGFYKLADNADNFTGTLAVLDKTEQEEIQVELDTPVAVGSSLCTLYKSGSALWLDVAEGRSRISDDSMTVTENNLSWESDHEDDFVLEFSDGASGLAVSVENTQVSLYNVPSAISGWRVKCDDESFWTSEQSLEGSDNDTPKVVATEADEVDDVLFVQASGVWGDDYVAQNTGDTDGSWKGTGERVLLSGKNRFADVFQGNETDANILLLTNDADALFLDDIYTASAIEQKQARLQAITEIVAGAGDDIVDMTGLHCSYTTNRSMTLRGGDGNDILWGGGCDCSLYGDAGDDRLVGSKHNDFFCGGIGDDVMVGGGGEDVFYFEDNWGNDEITLCNGGNAVLQFADGISGVWDEEQMKYTYGENSVQIYCHEDYKPTITIR